MEEDWLLEQQEGDSPATVALRKQYSVFLATLARAEEDRLPAATINALRLKAAEARERLQPPGWWQQHFPMESTADILIWHQLARHLSTSEGPWQEYWRNMISAAELELKRRGVAKVD